MREVLDEEQAATDILRCAPEEAMDVLPPGWHLSSRSTDGNIPGQRYRCAQTSTGKPKFLTKNLNGSWELLTRTGSNKVHAF